MDAHPESAANRTVERFAYFMVRIQTNGDTRARSSGIVERLGTGRKQSFSTVEELVHLLTDDSGDVQNMRVGTVGGNDPALGAADLQQDRYESPNNLLGDK
jgi:hypothetical protein